MSHEMPNNSLDSDASEFKKEIDKLCKELGIARESDLPENDSEVSSEVRAKRIKLRDLSEKLKKIITQAGYKVVDANAFVKGGEFYSKADPDVLVHANLPRMLEINPDFLTINNLDFKDIKKRLREIYGNDDEMLKRYKTNDAVYERVKYSFNVNFKHLLFYMERHPDDEQFQEVLHSVKAILDGRFIEID